MTWKPIHLQSFLRVRALHAKSFRALARKHRAWQGFRPQSCCWLEMAARAWPSATAGSKWPLERALETQNARQVPFASAPEPRNARLAPFERPQKCRMLDRNRSSLLWRHSGARAHCREVRSLLAFEMAARRMLARVPVLSALFFSRFHLASCTLCTGSH